MGWYLMGLVFGCFTIYLYEIYKDSRAERRFNQWRKRREAEQALKEENSKDNVHLRQMKEWDRMYDNGDLTKTGLAMFLPEKYVEKFADAKIELGDIDEVCLQLKRSEEAIDRLIATKTTKDMRKFKAMWE